MVSFTKQLGLLLWKAYVIRKKKKILLAVEVLVPLLLFLLIVLIRTRNFTTIYPHCHYDARALPSAGLLPFIHGFLCSFSNKCYNRTTTDDEFADIQDENRESILIKLAHDVALILSELGNTPSTVSEAIKMAAMYIHHYAHPDDGFNEARIPFSVLFRSSDDMTALFSALGYKEVDNDKFRNLYLSSQWPLCALIMRSKGNPIHLLCEEDFLDMCFDWSMVAEPRPSLCLNAFILLGMDLQRYVDPDGLLLRILSYSVADQSELQRLNASSLKTSTVNSKLKEIGKELDFIDFSLDKIFCGNFSESAGLDSPDEKVNSGAFSDIFRDVYSFIRRANPAAHGGNSTFCDNIIVNDLPHCSNQFMNLKLVKPVVHGYILVSPDTPLVRQVVGELEDKFKEWNYWKDLLHDFEMTAEDLQTALNESDLPLAAEHIAEVLDWDEKTKTLVMDLLGNSSNPNGLFIIMKNMVASINNNTDCLRMDRIRYVADESEMERIAYCLTEESHYMAGIVFEDFDNQTTKIPDVVKYKIRYEHSLVDSTKRYRDVISMKSRDRPLFDVRYVTFGYAFMQDILERSLIKYATNVTVEHGLRMQQEPFPCVLLDTFDVTMFLSLFIILLWMTPACFLVKNIVHEKEMRLKEMMRIMGMGDVIHWMVWALQTLLMNTVAIVLIVVMLKYGGIMKHASVGLMFLTMFPFATACAAQCVFISTFFSRANLATPCTALMFFVFYIPFFLSFNTGDLTFLIFTLLLPQSAIGYAFIILATANLETDAAFHRVIYMKFFGTEIQYFHVLIALAVDTIMYSVAAWYISAVFPGDYGIAQPFYFFLTKRYWFGVGEGTHKISDEDDEICEDVEAVEGSVAIRILHMTKVYSNNTKALDDLHVNFYENQITGFLGHNGAGKTTTMSILCGLYPPSEGTARVYHMDIRTDMTEIRKTLGICPQHNILFDEMTVEEQLYFYGYLKNIPRTELGGQVDVMIQDLGLTSRRKFLVDQLSGGMKRKLCIGIALMGGSKLVILDEPTAGIDAHARRSIWALLEKHKPRRTILLSTHHMDEAQILSDRIVIVSEGKLRAAGSMNFLKGRFSVGYTLIMELKSTHHNRPVGNTKAELGELLTKARIQDFKLMEESNALLTYRIPIQTSPTEFQRLFALLSDRKDDLHIDKFALNGPSLQDVFLAAAPQKDIHLKKASGFMEKVKQKLLYRSRNYVVEADESKRCMEPEDHDLNHPPMGTISSTTYLRFQQFTALLKKRIQITKRSPFAILFELLLPLIAFFAAEIYVVYQFPSETQRVMNEQPPIPMDSALYGEEVSRYIGVWNTSSSTTKYISSLLENPGPGLGCVMPYPLYGYRAKLNYQRCYDTAPVNNTLVYPITPPPYSIALNFSCDSTLGWQCSAEYPDDVLQKIVFNTTEYVYNVIERNISEFRMATFANTSMSTYGIIGGYEYGQRNPKALTTPGVVRAQLCIMVSYDAFNVSFDKINFTVNEVLSQYELLTHTDPFLVDNITLDRALVSLVRKLDTEELVKVWFNNKAWTSIPTNINTHYNSVLRYLKKTLKLSNSSQYVGILNVNHPIPQSATDTLDNNSFMQKVGITRVIMIILVVSIILASFSMLLVEENVTNSKNLQRIFGVPSWLYYFTNSIYDFVIYLCCVIILFAGLCAIGVDLFIFNGEAVLVTFLVFFLFGLSCLPWVYVFQYAFKIPSLSFGVQSITFYLMGVASALTIVILENMQLEDDIALTTAHNICSQLFKAIPLYNLGMSIFRMTVCNNILMFAKRYLKGIRRPELIDEIPLPSLFQKNLVGQHLVALACNAIVYNVLCLLFEYRDSIIKFRRNWERLKTKQLIRKENLTSSKDVRQEQELVENLDDYENYGLVVKNLAKSYDGKNLVVKGVSFAAEKGECFGLLGVNGAGKTTTFSMLTGFLNVGYGEIIVDGESRSSSVSFRNVGYCPQFDALFPKLTAIEHLEFYAKIRGIKSADISASVSWAIDHMQLKPYALEIAKSYSGGNKRKLSAAIAIITDPNVVLLDEPSAGMDPRSQKFMWDLITDLKQNNRTVIMTSHSMEECEALCNRTAIMVQGKFYCIGTIQSLKERFGGGYTLNVKLESDTDMKTCQKLVQEMLPDAKCMTSNLCTLMFSVPLSNTSLVKMFDALKTIETKMKLLDFSVFQTTLDDVFVNLARSAESGTTSSDLESEDSAEEKHDKINNTKTTDGAKKNNSKDDGNPHRNGTLDKKDKSMDNVQQKNSESSANKDNSSTSQDNHNHANPISNPTDSRL
ncbi:unnamed protein product [Bursaphelenchus okinawaensis]|uniref:ABC transporter domain-containing protein n=1 Tax=Bursaphelenchus okinawaensis TaxID=465554 RepID=A0A811JT03_9BILA|nr:unnamed protein product [Bursaphelenchus okinawaensis]CAG9081603.1 unnamed protein product [Bursaphelenchus okinawaensis]